MNAIRIRKTLDSETLHLPELKPLLGKAVEIIILEDDAPTRRGTGDWDAAARAVAELKDFDYDALAEQDACDRLHAGDPLP